MNNKNLVFGYVALVFKPGLTRRSTDFICTVIFRTFAKNQKHGNSKS